MSNYTKSTNFATKDNLSPGDPLKIVRGTEIDTEFNNISTAISTKTDNSAAAITGGSITGITDLAIADGGTGASTATAAINNLLPAQTSAANKYLQSDGTNVSWDAVTLSTSDITGTLGVTNGGTGVTSSTGTGSVVLSNSPTLVTPALGTPASGVATNLTGLPISTGVSGLGTGVATFLGTPSSANLASAVSDETGTGALVFANSPTLVTPALGTPSSATLTNATGLPISTGVSGLGTGVATFLGTPSSANLASAVSDETGSGALVFANSPTLVTPALGTPSALVGTNITGTASGLTAGNVTTNANLTGAVTSTGNATLLGSFSSANLAGALTDETGSGSAVFATSPTLVTPTLGVATATSLQGIIGNVTPAAGSFTTLGASSTATLNTLSSSGATLTGGTINGMTVGATTASSGAFTTVTASTAIGTSSGGTGLSSFTSGGVVYASSTSALATSSAFQFNGTDLGLGVTPSVNTVSGFGYRQIEVGTSAGNMVFAGGNELLVVQNAIYNSGFKYAQSTQASYFRLNAGEHQFFTAPSGTAGNAISFTQALTLNADGKLLLGTTSAPDYHMMKIASTTEAGVTFTGANTVADDGTLSANILNGSVLMVSDNNTGDGGLFFCCYASATITLISDPNSKYATSITAGRICVTKSANSYSITITNKTGGTKSITFAKVSTSD